jgi:iron complex outermembrane recepter protein
MARPAAVAVLVALCTTAFPAPCSEAVEDGPGIIQDDESGIQTLGGMSVTARKREEMLQDVPLAVTAYSGEQLDRMDVGDLSDLDVHVPNLTIYPARGATSTVTAYIRGVGQSDPTWGSDPGVGIYLDDVYISRPQGALLDVFDVARIEVLRGPQGTLYGKNTVGGAIRYVSRKLPSTPEGFARMSIGSHSQFDLKAAIGGPVGGKDSGLLGRLAIASLNHAGFGRNAVTGAQASDKESNAARLGLGTGLGERIDVNVALDWIDDRSAMRAARMLAGNRFAPAFPPLDDRYDVRSGMRDINDVVTRGASAVVDWRASDAWSLKYVAAWRRADSVVNIDLDTTPLRLADSASEVQYRQASHELQAGYGGERATGVIGLYRFDGEAGGHTRNILLDALFSDFRGKLMTSSTALYADWIFNLGRDTELNLGARYTDEDKRGIVLNRNYGSPDCAVPTSVSADFDKTRNFSGISPKVLVSHAPAPDRLLYASASRGSKSGGYNIRANAVAIPASAEPFADETLDSFEVGAKMSFFGQRLLFNVAAFHNRYEDIQLSVFTSYDSTGDGVDDAFFGDFTNAGRGTIDGVEAEFQLLPSPTWLFSGNLSWLDARYDEYLDRGVDVASQKHFTNAPAFSGRLALEYRKASANGGELRARAGYSYQSEVWPTTDLTRELRQPGYGLLDAAIMWQPHRAWQFSLQGSNLADTRYLTTGYSLPAVGVLTGFYGPPRQYSVSVHYSF